MDIDHQLIREIETTPASMQDNQIDLTNPGEVNYRDRGYFGAPCKGYNATMKRATRGHPLNISEKNAQPTHNTPKSTRRTTIRRNQKHIPLRPRKSHHNTQNTHQKYIHPLLLQPTTTKHHQTKKHTIANANKKIKNITQK
jgi:hypothetical protein